jgi:hypothetical protein
MFTKPRLQKDVLLSAVRFALWQAFKRMSRINRVRATAESAHRRATATARRQTATPIEETRKCGSCGAYVPVGASCCDKLQNRA